MTDHIVDEAIILAGGLGTRLRSVTETPKILAKICDRPFIEYLLDHLIENGLRRIVFAVGYKHELIIKHFENGYRGLDIDFAIEKESLGTGGAIVNALAKAKNQKVLILNGDVYCSFNASELISDSDLLITAIEVDDISRYGSLEIKGDNLISFLEKGSNGRGYINAGIYFADKKAFQDYPLGGKEGPGCNGQ